MVVSKLCSYKIFKLEYETENYLTVNLPFRHRSALAKFRCGVAPLRIETGRYERLPLESKLCSQCNLVENECMLYVIVHYMKIFEIPYLNMLNL